MRFLILSFLVITAIVPAQSRQTFTGIVTDTMCAAGDHSNMRMGPTAGECTTACVAAHGALYVLHDGKETYALSDQKTPEKFAGKRVSVTGTLDAKTRTIQVNSMAAAN